MSRREPDAARLLRTFLDELDERRADLERALLALERERRPAERARLVAEMFRAVHSLKGAAHAVGIAPLESLCHDLESRLAAVREAGGELDAELIQRLLVANDAMGGAGRRLRAGESLDAADLATLLAGGTPSPHGSTRPRDVALAIPEGETTVGGGGSAESVRLGAETLDAILARWSEATVERRRLSAGLVALDDVSNFVADWRAEWRRQRPGLRGTGVEGAAATRRLDDRLSAVATLVADRIAAATDAARALDRVSGALDAHLRGARMQLFAEACAGLERVVRDLALAQEKLVRLEVVGGDVALDRAVISRLRDVLRHLVRNAVDHGVELPAARLAAGKPAEATVRVSAAVSGDRVQVAVSDDGAGFDEAAIRDRAAMRALPTPRPDAGILDAQCRDDGVGTRRRPGRRTHGSRGAAWRDRNHLGTRAGQSLRAARAALPRDDARRARTRGRCDLRPRRRGRARHAPREKRRPPAHGGPRGPGPGGRASAPGRELGLRSRVARNGCGRARDRPGGVALRRGRRGRVHGR